MTNGANMICPSCGAFQPRAEVCKKCGIIIAKASKPAVTSPGRTTAAPGTGKQPLLLIILAAVIALPVLGYFLFAGGDEGESTVSEPTSAAQPERAAARSEVDRIGTVNPGAATELHRSQVQSKLHTLRTQLNLYLVETDQPPSNEEGLQSLVDKGILTAVDITDDWGNAFGYRLEWVEETALEKKFTIYLFSKGPDGIAGNADDIGI